MRAGARVNLREWKSKHLPRAYCDNAALSGFRQINLPHGYFPSSPPPFALFSDKLGFYPNIDASKSASNIPKDGLPRLDAEAAD